MVGNLCLRLSLLRHIHVRCDKAAPKNWGTTDIKNSSIWPRPLEGMCTRLTHTLHTISDLRLNIASAIFPPLGIRAKQIFHGRHAVGK